ncbi:multicopper oxidase domain-containing protein [Cyanobium sp. ATX 6F1]|uniref:multicopper oxidase domain-containing protein n=1 Tax=Cyanobium sp. ATX 6F1 TaxID=2823702 RepID=UPI0020CE99C5|nr:multicopper oxidase domain-containing protein [Cyanobium sp. ATX 6F1]MCP9917366.1 multicopper oxidase domain-containing protein [Cyanobium sp. ATX 6F1]
MALLSLLLGLALILGLALAVNGRSHQREYWIQAEEILWDYAPSYPINRMMGMPFRAEENTFVERRAGRIGRVYRKAVFRSYSAGYGAILDGPRGVQEAEPGADASPLRRPGSREEHLGNLGPILRAEVGDTLVVHLRNQTRFPVSLHPHGVLYDKASEGSPYADGSSPKDRTDDDVPPGASHTYQWQVPERAGPGPADPDSIVWPYHSHVNEVADTSAGLVGPIIIHRKGQLDENRRLPKGVDHEFVGLYAITDENQSLFLDSNIAEFINNESIDRSDEEFIESNLMHGINGFVYADLPGLTMRQGEHVRWYLLAMGTETDLHTPHWHGSTLLENGRRIDTTDIFPATSRTLDMVPDVPGVWMMHCHVNDHMVAGMQALFRVDPR